MFKPIPNNKSLFYRKLHYFKNGHHKTFIEELERKVKEDSIGVNVAEQMLKLELNSNYKPIVYNYFPIFDKNIAETICITGQVTIEKVE